MPKKKKPTAGSSYILKKGAIDEREIARFSLLNPWYAADAPTNELRKWAYFYWRGSLSESASQASLDTALHYVHLLNCLYLLHQENAELYKTALEEASAQFASWCSQQKDDSAFQAMQSACDEMKEQCRLNSMGGSGEIEKPLSAIMSLCVARLVEHTKYKTNVMLLCDAFIRFFAKLNMSQVASLDNECMRMAEPVMLEFRGRVKYAKDQCNAEASPLSAIERATLEYARLGSYVNFCSAYALALMQSTEESDQKSAVKAVEYLSDYFNQLLQGRGVLHQKDIKLIAVNLYIALKKWLTVASEVQGLDLKDLRSSVASRLGLYLYDYADTMLDARGDLPETKSEICYKKCTEGLYFLLEACLHYPFDEPNKEKRRALGNLMGFRPQAINFLLKMHGVGIFNLHFYYTPGQEVRVDNNLREAQTFWLGAESCLSERNKFSPPERRLELLNRIADRLEASAKSKFEKSYYAADRVLKIFRLRATMEEAVDANFENSLQAFERFVAIFSSQLPSLLRGVKEADNAELCKRFNDSFENALYHLSYQLKDSNNHDVKKRAAQLILQFVRSFSEHEKDFKQVTVLFPTQHVFERVLDSARILDCFEDSQRREIEEWAARAESIHTPEVSCEIKRARVVCEANRHLVAERWADAEASFKAWARNYKHPLVVGEPKSGEQLNYLARELRRCYAQLGKKDSMDRIQALLSFVVKSAYVGLPRDQLDSSERLNPFAVEPARVAKQLLLESEYLASIPGIKEHRALIAEVDDEENWNRLKEHLSALLGLLPDMLKDCTQEQVLLIIKYCCHVMRKLQSSTVVQENTLLDKFLKDIQVQVLEPAFKRVALYDWTPTVIRYFAFAERLGKRLARCDDKTKAAVFRCMVMIPPKSRTDTEWRIAISSLTAIYNNLISSNAQTVGLAEKDFLRYMRLMQVGMTLSKVDLIQYKTAARMIQQYLVYLKKKGESKKLFDVYANCYRFKQVGIDQGLDFAGFLSPSMHHFVFDHAGKSEKTRSAVFYAASFSPLDIEPNSLVGFAQLRADCERYIERCVANGREEFEKLTLDDLPAAGDADAERHFSFTAGQSRFLAQSAPVPKSAVMQRALMIALSYELRLRFQGAPMAYLKLSMYWPNLLAQLQMSDGFDKKAVLSLVHQWLDLLMEFRKDINLKAKSSNRILSSLEGIACVCGEMPSEDVSKLVQLRADQANHESIAVNLLVAYVLQGQPRDSDLLVRSLDAMCHIKKVENSANGIKRSGHLDQLSVVQLIQLALDFGQPGCPSLRFLLDRFVTVDRDRQYSDNELISMYHLQVARVRYGTPNFEDLKWCLTQCRVRLKAMGTRIGDQWTHLLQSFGQELIPALLNCPAKEAANLNACFILCDQVMNDLRELKFSVGDKKTVAGLALAALNLYRQSITRPGIDSNPVKHHEALSRWHFHEILGGSWEYALHASYLLMTGLSRADDRSELSKHQTDEYRDFLVNHMRYNVVMHREFFDVFSLVLRKFVKSPFITVEENLRAQQLLRIFQFSSGPRAESSLGFLNHVFWQTPLSPPTSQTGFGLPLLTATNEVLSEQLEYHTMVPLGFMAGMLIPVEKRTVKDWRNMMASFVRCVGPATQYYERSGDVRVLEHLMQLADECYAHLIKREDMGLGWQTNYWTAMAALFEKRLELKSSGLPYYESLYKKMEILPDFNDQSYIQTDFPKAIIAGHQTGIYKINLLAFRALTEAVRYPNVAMAFMAASKALEVGYGSAAPAETAVLEAYVKKHSPEAGAAPREAVAQKNPGPAPLASVVAPSTQKPPAERNPGPSATAPAAKRATVRKNSPPPGSKAALPTPKPKPIDPFAEYQKTLKRFCESSNTTEFPFGEMTLRKVEGLAKVEISGPQNLIEKLKLHLVANRKRLKQKMLSSGDLGIDQIEKGKLSLLRWNRLLNGPDGLSSSEVWKIATNAHSATTVVVDADVSSATRVMTAARVKFNRDDENQRAAWLQALGTYSFGAELREREVDGVFRGFELRFKKQDEVFIAFNKVKGVNGDPQWTAAQIQTQVMARLSAIFSKFIEVSFDAENACIFVIPTYRVEDAVLPDAKARGIYQGAFSSEQTKGQASLTDEEKWLELRQSVLGQSILDADFLNDQHFSWNGDARERKITLRYSLQSDSHASGYSHAARLRALATMLNAQLQDVPENKSYVSFKLERGEITMSIPVAACHAVKAHVSALTTAQLREASEVAGCGMDDLSQHKTPGLTNQEKWAALRAQCFGEQVLGANFLGGNHFSWYDTQKQNRIKLRYHLQSDSHASGYSHAARLYALVEVLNAQLNTVSGNTHHLSFKREQGCITVGIPVDACYAIRDRVQALTAEQLREASLVDGCNVDDLPAPEAEKALPVTVRVVEPKPARKTAYQMQDVQVWVRFLALNFQNHEMLGIHIHMMSCLVVLQKLKEADLQDEKKRLAFCFSATLLLRQLSDLSEWSNAQTPMEKMGGSLAELFDQGKSLYQLNSTDLWKLHKVFMVVATMYRVEHTNKASFARKSKKNHGLLGPMRVDDKLVKEAVKGVSALIGSLMAVVDDEPSVPDECYENPNTYVSKDTVDALALSMARWLRGSDKAHCSPVNFPPAQSFDNLAAGLFAQSDEAQSTLGADAQQKLNCSSMTPEELEAMLDEFLGEGAVSGPGASSSM